MARQHIALVAFNRGLISRLALARADIKRVAMSAETMFNLIPRVMGSMMLRPGTQYLQETRDNLASRDIPFVFSISDKAGIELTDQVMRVMVINEYQVNLGDESGRELVRKQMKAFLKLGEQVDTSKVAENFRPPTS